MTNLIHVKELKDDVTYQQKDSYIQNMMANAHDQSNPYEIGRVDVYAIHNSLVIPHQPVMF